MKNLLQIIFSKIKSILNSRLFVNTSAMTLVETIMALSIITAMLGLSAYALNRFYRNSLLDTASAQILSDLRTLQNYAVNNYIPENANAIENWKSPFLYEFKLKPSILSGQAGYQSLAYPYDPVNATVIIGNQNQLDQTRVLDKNISIKFTNTANKIDFIGVENRIQINGDCNPNHACLQIGLADSTTEYRLIYINCAQKIIKELDIKDEAQCN